MVALQRCLEDRPGGACYGPLDDVEPFTAFGPGQRNGSKSA